MVITVFCTMCVNKYNIGYKYCILNHMQFGIKIAFSNFQTNLSALRHIHYIEEKITLYLYKYMYRLDFSKLIQKWDKIK